MVESDQGQPSQGSSQPGQKRKQTDDLLASDESEVESEPDEEQERKAVVAKMMKEGVLSADAKGHAHVGALKDTPAKPAAVDTVQGPLDQEHVKETERISDEAPLVVDSGGMDIDQGAAHLKLKDNETVATSGEKEESHTLSKSQLKRMRKKQKMQEMDQRTESLAPASALSDAPQRETSTAPESSTLVATTSQAHVESATPDLSTNGMNPPTSEAPPPNNTAAEPIVLANLDALMATKASQGIFSISNLFFFLSGSTGC